MHHRVYVIQLGPDPKRVYVGSTGLTADQRLADHRAGRHSSRIVHAHRDRLKLRPDLAPAGVWTYSKAVQMEGETARALIKRGFSVHWG